MSQPDDPLLRELRGAGEAESAGRFTVDADAARKLRRHRFADPRMYVLPFLASAVLSGAGRVEVRTLKHGLELQHDGLPLSREDLAALAADPWRGGARTALDRMALAWHTAMELGPKALTLDSLGLRLAADGSLSGHPHAGVRLTVLERRPWTLLPREAPEIRYLRERAWPAPTELLHDGKPLALALGWATASAWTHGQSARVLATPAAPPETLGRRAEHDAFTYLLALDTAVPWRDPQAGALAFVIDGVLFVQRGVDLGVPHAVALVAADGIDFDLSWSGAVHNRASEDVAEALRGEAALLEETLVLRTLPASASEAVLARMHRHWRRRGDLLRLHVVLAELVRRNASEAPRLLASVLLKAGQAAEACAALQDVQARTGPWGQPSEVELAADLVFAWQALDPAADAPAVAARVVERARKLGPRESWLPALAACAALAGERLEADTGPFFVRLALAATLEQVRALRDEARDRDERASAADHETVLLLGLGLDAVACAEEALERDRALHGLAHLETAGSAVALAVARGGDAQAAPLLHGALSVCHPAERGEILACATALAAARGDWAVAAGFGRRAVEGLPPLRSLIWREYLGYLEWRRGRRDEALAEWRAAAVLRQHAGGPRPRRGWASWLRDLPRRTPVAEVQVAISHRGWFTTGPPYCSSPPLRLAFRPLGADALPDVLEEAAQDLRRREPVLGAALAAALRERAAELR